MTLSLIWDIHLPLALGIGNPDSRALGLRLNCTTDFTGYLACRQQMVGLLGLQNCRREYHPHPTPTTLSLSLCTCTHTQTHMHSPLILFLWRNLMKMPFLRTSSFFIKD